MVGGRDVIDEEFERTWARIGLSRTLPPLSFSATIDEKTLRLLAPDAPTVPPPDAEVPTLPRIVMAGAGPAERSRSTPDLEVSAILGEGGMGQVLLARQRSLDREVAVKQLKPAASETDARVLCQEAMLTGKLEHPNIVPVHALGHGDDGLPLMVMKRVDGVSWGEMLRDPDHASWASVERDPERRLVWHLETLMQLCNAVAFAHSRGVIHRDIKPDNVMIGDFGQVYVVDWGIAGPPAAAGLPLLGTPAYMAPEQLQGSADERTDIYLLGSTLHEILTGELRHRGETLYEVARAAHRSEPVTYGPEVPEELSALANRATSRDPARRPATVLALRGAIADHLGHRDSAALCVVARERLERAVRMLDSEQPELSPVRRPLDEAFFGYRQALERWPDNPAASQGLRQCTVAQVRFELSQRHADAARAMLATLPDPPPELLAGLRALDQELSREQAEQAELRRMAREMDQWVSNPLRRLVMLVWGLPVIGVMVYLLATAQQARAYSHGQLLALAAGEVTLGLVLLAIAWRRVIVNQFNRRVGIWFFVLLGCMVFGRGVGLLAGADQGQMVVAESVALGAVCGAAGALLFRWMWLGMVFFWLGALLGALLPGTELVARTAAGMLTIIAGTVLWRPGLAPRRSKADVPPP